MLTYHTDPEKRLIEVTLSGKVSREELRKTIEEIQEPFESWPEIRILKRIDSFDGIEWRALVDDLKFVYQNLGNFKKIKKVAVVSDKEWIENLSEWLGPVFFGEVKTFENEDIESARSWLT